jgi:hypothetical protein
MEKGIISELNNKFIRRIDKKYRMFAGLASELVDYRDDIIYLHISISKRWPKPPEVTASQLAGDWKTYNPELAGARGYDVRIARIQNDTGFSVSPEVAENTSYMNVLIARMSAGYEEMKLEPEEFVRIRKLFTPAPVNR